MEKRLTVLVCSGAGGDGIGKWKGAARCIAALLLSVGYLMPNPKWENREEKHQASYVFMTKTTG